MAYCPSCNAAMGQTAVNCDSCGFEFPNALPEERTHLAWSKLADVSLVIASVISLLTSAAAFLFAAYLIAIVLGSSLIGSGPSSRELIQVSMMIGGSLMYALLSFAMYVVFIRVQKDE